LAHLASILLPKKSLRNLSSWCVLQEHGNKQHMPPIIPFSPGGISYKRYKCYSLPQRGLDHRYPLEEVTYLDYLSKRAQWKMCHLEGQGKNESLLLPYLVGIVTIMLKNVQSGLKD
uniref:Uncharacterized protein n=1 Tax=Corvus moneduloides TaxID=1196302 RepID=A0A8C3E2C5_CORMO